MANILKKAITQPRVAVEWLLERSHVLYGLSDESYLRFLWWVKTGKKLNLDNPQTYNEKLQWLKLHDRKPLYTTIVDKVLVKQWVAETLGDKKSIIPTIAVWDNVNEIDVSQLPERFVLKTNNGSSSAGVVICRNRDTFDLESAKRKLARSLKGSVYKDMREWPYKNIVPKVFAEEYVEDASGELRDYKFFCFDGEVKALFIGTERFSDEVKFDFFDAAFNHLDLYQIHPMSGREIPKPENFEEMKAMAARLSKGFPHVRVDLYNVQGKIYFGEVTFYHHGGFAPWHPEKWDYEFGSWIKLPSVQQ